MKGGAAPFPPTRAQGFSEGGQAPPLPSPAPCPLGRCAEWAWPAAGARSSRSAADVTELRLGRACKWSFWSAVSRAGAGPRGGNRGRNRYQERGEQRNSLWEGYGQARGKVLFQPSSAFLVSRFKLLALGIQLFSLQPFCPQSPGLSYPVRHRVGGRSGQKLMEVQLMTSSDDVSVRGPFPASLILCAGSVLPGFPPGGEEGPLPGPWD